MLVNSCLDAFEAFLLVMMSGGACLWAFLYVIRGRVRDAGKISHVKEEDCLKWDIAQILMEWVNLAPPGVRAFRVGHMIERRMVSGTSTPNLVIELQIVGPDQSRRREKVEFEAALLKDREKTAKALSIVLDHFSRG